MNKYIKAILISFMSLVSAQSFAGTYDGSWYTDQQRITMINNYANEVNNKSSAFGIEKIEKYGDTRLLNGKKGYVGSIVITRSDSFLNSSNGTGYAKEAIVHLFDFSVVRSFSVSDASADCRTFIPSTKTNCFGTTTTKNTGLVLISEVKTSRGGSTSLGTQYSKEETFAKGVYYTAYRSTGATTRTTAGVASYAAFNDITKTNGLIYNALQNADNSWPTVEVLTPPMDYVIALPEPLPVDPVVITTQDCANPDASNTTNSSICLIGQVIEGCKLSTGNYYTAINSVAGNVGLTAVDVKITCSTGTPFHIKPIHDKIELAGTDETLRLTGWKDSGRADKLTPLSAKVMNGAGSEQSIPIYFTLEGKGKSGLYGNSVVNKYNGSTVYPIQIVY